MRTGGRSLLARSLVGGTARRRACSAAADWSCRCPSASASGGIVQTAFVSAAASVWATNNCSIDRPRPWGTASSSSPVIVANAVGTKRRISATASRRRGRLGIEGAVGARQHLIDDALHGLPRVGCVVLHVIARGVDARNL